MSKKIGILTQPLHDNYGGLLQAYALKTVLEKQNAKVEVINRKRDTESSKFFIKNFIKKVLGKKTTLVLNDKQKETISKNTNYFNKKYIKNVTKPVINTNGLKEISTNYDLFFVGSDQVWRPSYSPQISNYYLDFLPDNEQKGVAYAASFGVDTWEYNEAQTAICKKNVSKFKAISVREDSGIKLCKEHLDVPAVHVVDPTMLLTKEEYVTLIEQENEPAINGELMHYVLDSNNDKEALINNIASFYDYKIFSCHQKKKVNKENLNNIDDCVFPRVTKWLNGFHTAKFIITDSFHGTAFSILFNKPFLVVANSKRGKARFDSLLKMFNLQDRLLVDINDIKNLKIEDLKPIDWEQVNNILADKKKFAINFIVSNLS